MSFKYYSLTADAYARDIVNAKMPLQQKQLYAALVRLGVPSRGVDIVAEAKRAGLITRQDEAVLAAWYFSVKRRPACITVSGDATPPASESKEVRIARLQAELARLTAEDVETPESE